MSFEEGCLVNDIEAIKRQQLNPADVAALVSRVFSSQMFLHGFVHCDPHSANILVRTSKSNFNINKNFIDFLFSLIS